MNDPESALVEFVQGILDDESRAGAGLAAVVPSKEWLGHVLSEDVGGLDGIIQKLIRMVEADHLAVPILACGLLRRSQVEKRVEQAGRRQLLLWHWPGFAYLPYGFTKDELLAAVRKVVEGAKTPLPPGLLPTPGDVLGVTSEVRHWLDNRRQNVERSLDDFARVERGEVRLHPSHREPVTAISDAHRRMLDRLWALETAALRFAPSMGGLAPMKAAVGEFEICWMELESRRAALRSDDYGGNAERFAKMVMALEAVFNAIENAIAASRALDVEIHAKMVMR